MCESDRAHHLNYIRTRLKGLSRQVGYTVGKVVGETASLLRRDDGTSAIEFALIGPMLAIGLLFMGFMAVRIHRYIDIDQILRAGTEAAIKDPGEIEVAARMTAVAQAKGYSVHQGGSPVPYDKVVLTSARACICPDAVLVTRGCDTLCPDQRPTAVKYTITGSLISYYDDEFMRSMSYLGLGIPAVAFVGRKSVLVR